MLLFSITVAALAWPSLVALATPLPETTSAAPAPSAAPSVATVPAAVIPAVEKIEIPVLGISAPLHLNVSAERMEEVLPTGAAVLDSSPLPGQAGNFFVVGHSSDYPWKKDPYATLFARLPRLAVGSEIDVFHGGQEFRYRVTGKKVVAATDLSVEDQTAAPTLTLLTCYPIGTTFSRYIVTAELIK